MATGVPEFREVAWCAWLFLKTKLARRSEPRKHALFSQLRTMVTDQNIKALLDRLLHHAQTVVIEGKSYRMKDQVKN